MPRKIDHERIKFLATVEGLSRQEVADQLGIPYSTVANSYWRQGLDSRWVQVERHAQIVALASEGLTRQEIADRLGLSYDRVAVQIRTRKIECVAESLFAVPEDRVGEVRGLAAEGWGLPRLSRRLGVSERAVWNFMVAHDIPRGGQRKNPASRKNVE